MADCRWAIFLLAAISPVFSASNYVPVVMWQSQSLGNALPSVSAVHQMSRNEFEEDILNKLDHKSPILWFIQDDLSMEDFTLWGNVFGNQDQKNSFSNIQSLLDTNPSTMLPSVESPENGISALANGRKVVEVNGEAFPPEDKLDNNLFVVHLPSTDAASDRQKALSKNDKIIGDTIRQVSESSSLYTAIYTGHSSSWVSAEKEHTRSSRHALAYGSESPYNHTGLFFHNNATCILYFENITIDVYTKSSTDETAYSTQSSIPLSEDWSFYTFSCTGSNESMTVTIDYNNPDTNANVTKATIQMLLHTVDYNDWNLTSLSLDYKTNFGSGYDFMTVDDQFWAPLQASYHCSPQSFISDMYNINITSRTQKSGINFYNFQVQPFENGGVFGDAFDCVGFFSIGIWMGIFVVSILILILGFGINMTMSINTMDRFDDPKGKTITVNASD